MSHQHKVELVQNVSEAFYNRDWLRDDQSPPRWGKRLTPTPVPGGYYPDDRMLHDAFIWSSIQKAWFLPAFPFIFPGVLPLSTLLTMDSKIDSKDAHALEVERPTVYAEKATVKDFKADAIEAENAEHNMTVLQAVKAYPMASFWAFVMSCTIVSDFNLVKFHC